jgi:hypothetical protein
MSDVMNDVAEHWNMPWHAWLKSLAQTPKAIGAPQFGAAYGLGAHSTRPRAWRLLAD